MVPSQEELEKMHNGLMGATISDSWLYMRKIISIIKTSPIPHSDYIVDAKVHMLMPGQYPCIPNWHFDHVPRNEAGQMVLEDRDSTQKMFLWLSGPPFTEFADGREVRAGEWTEFTQFDSHRGVKSEEHQWRLLIRLTPASIHPHIRHGEKCLRRHSQVYLDADNFKW